MNSAIKSMAESAAMLNKTLAMGMQMIFNNLVQQPCQMLVQPGLTSNIREGQPAQTQTQYQSSQTPLQFAFHSPTHMQTATVPATQQFVYTNDVDSNMYQFIDQGN